MKKIITFILKDWYMKLLELLLLVVGVASLINVITVYWRVDIFPISSFLSVWYMITAFIEKSYYMILNSAVICALLLGSVYAVYKRWLVLPFMTLLFLMYDLYVIITWFVAELDSGSWKIFVPLMITSFVLNVLLIVYCCVCWRRKHPRKKTFY